MQFSFSTPPSPTAARNRRIALIALGVAFGVAHTVTGWYWIPAFVSGTFFGWYWPLLIYTQAVEPVMGVGVVIGIALLAVALVGRARGNPSPARLRWGIGLLAASLFLGLTGLPAVFRPLTHSSTTLVNDHTYHLATYHNLGGDELLLFECDLAGFGCQQVYRSDAYAPGALDSASLISDNPRATISVKACAVTPTSLTADTCDVIETYQQRLFK